MDDETESDKHEDEEQKYGSMDERANMGARMGANMRAWDHGCTCIVLTGHSQRTHDHSHMILCVCPVSPRQCNFAYMQLFIEGVIRQVMLYIEQITSIYYSSRMGAGTEDAVEHDKWLDEVVRD